MDEAHGLEAPERVRHCPLRDVEDPCELRRRPFPARPGEEIQNGKVRNREALRQGAADSRANEAFRRHDLADEQDSERIVYPGISHSSPASARSNEGTARSNRENAFHDRPGTVNRPLDGARLAPCIIVPARYLSERVRTVKPPPILFDARRLALQRWRAARSPASAWFLHEHAAALLAGRLEEINRPFERPVIAGWRADQWRRCAGLPDDCPCIPEDELPGLAEAGHDLVVSAMALHWENDPVGRLVQARRALGPDGLFVAVLFGGRTLAELRAAFAHAESLVDGGISPRVAPMGDIRDLGNLLQRAGYALPVADSVTVPVSYETPLHLMRDLRAMGETNALAGRRRRFLKRATLDAAVSSYSRNHPADGGRVLATFEIIFLSGWAPDTAQQTPLRPGSAAARLADALGTEEHGPDG